MNTEGIASLKIYFNENIANAIAWFNALEPSNRQLVAKIILQESNPEKYLTEDPTKDELIKYLKNRKAKNITFASIQELGRTPQIQEILQNPKPSPSNWPKTKILRNKLISEDLYHK